MDSQHGYLSTITPSNLSLPLGRVTNLSTEAITVHDSMGLLVNNFHLCLGICTPKRSACSRVARKLRVAFD